jgi:aminoglycoside 6'-N-acetyltransferase I
MLTLVEVSRDRFRVWRALREELYRNVEESFHDVEMDLILAAPDATCFLGYCENGEAVAMLELTLRNYVDGCLGRPIGYIEGVYIRPEWRSRSYGRELVDYAADWFRSRGCSDMAADAELDNTGAQAFLGAVGFAETYRVVEFKKSLEDPG